jgi:head-tail adaptor
MWLAQNLRHRLQIRKPVITPKSTGSLGTTYTTLTTIWAEIKPVSEYLKSIRGAQTQQGNYTHVFTVRTAAIIQIGREFDLGFDTGFKNMSDISQIKSEWFLFMEHGGATKGTLYKVTGIQRDDDHHEFAKIYAEEYYEKGTGWPK